MEFLNKIMCFYGNFLGKGMGREEWEDLGVQLHVCGDESGQLVHKSINGPPNSLGPEMLETLLKLKYGSPN